MTAPRCCSVTVPGGTSRFTQHPDAHNTLQIIHLFKMWIPGSVATLSPELTCKYGYQYADRYLYIFGEETVLRQGFESEVSRSLPRRGQAPGPQFCETNSCWLNLPYNNDKPRGFISSHNKAGSRPLLGNIVTAAAPPAPRRRAETGPGGAPRPPEATPERSRHPSLRRDWQSASPRHWPAPRYRPRIGRRR